MDKKIVGILRISKTHYWSNKQFSWVNNFHTYQKAKVSQSMSKTILNQTAQKTMVYKTLKENNHVSDTAFEPQTLEINDE